MISKWLWLMYLATVLPAAGGSADNWPRFRGSDALSVSDNPDLPLHWSATENVAWKTSIPGSGWSSPVVWGNKIFLTSVVSEQGEEEVKGGLYFGGERPAPKDPHHWMV
jgi:hypothetical protein